MHVFHWKISFLREVATKFFTLTQVTHNAKHCINYFLWMKNLQARKEIVSSINFYALPKARFSVLASNFKRNQRGECISHQLYQWIIGSEISSPIANHFVIHWNKLEIEKNVFPKTSLSLKLFCYAWNFIEYLPCFSDGVRIKLQTVDFL